ncbi:MAG: hypothetical protein V4536_08840 [Pseudomonadota bacterium]
MATQIEIGGRQISIGTLGIIDALRVEVAIAKVIGEPLFAALTTVKDGAEKMGVTALAIGQLASKMDADDLIKTMETVFKCVSVDGKRINSMEESFNGRNKEIWQVFIAALKANFADFFPENLLTSLSGTAQA